MEDIITLLPDHVANQIAAGEVIQRPASVVKELLENAVDAKASKIQLIIKDSGKTLIQVIDDGIGMSSTDIRLAFERHATSKIKKAEDLFHLNSKGFRGEALASIAAIAHVEVHAKRPVDQVANCLKIAGSQVESQEISPAPKGTSIAVKQLFFNIPARRNFLKSNTVELRHIIDEFQRVAMAHPEIHFLFLQNGSELFDLPKTNFRKRIVGIFGRRTDEKLVPIQEKTPLVLAEGFIVKPEYAKRTRGMQFFFVNKRFIKSPFLHHAVLAAFEGLIPKGVYPGYFIYLQVDPKRIDINIHPTKTEVKFDDEQSLYAILRATVKHSLGLFQVSPTLDFKREPTLDVPYAFKDKPVQKPYIEVDPSFNPFTPSTVSRKEDPRGWESLYSVMNEKTIESESIPENAQIPLDVKDTPKVFQLFSKYVVCAMKNSLLLVDQSRAHQRVLYERFLKSITTKKAVSQQLLFPVRVPITPPQALTLKGAQEILEALGFQIQFKENEEIVITGAPDFFPAERIGELMESVADVTNNENKTSLFSPADMIAKAMAGATAIKPGQTLNIEEQQGLLDDLFGCKESTVSPFNRQIFITLEKQDIDKRLH